MWRGLVCATCTLTLPGSCGAVFSMAQCSLVEQHIAQGLRKAPCVAALCFVLGSLGIWGAVA